MSELKLSLDELCQLMKSFSDAGLTSFTLREGDFVLKLGAEKPAAPVYMVPPAAGVAAPAAVPAMPAAVPQAAAPAASQPEAPAVPEGNVVKSPIVGTFYSAASPDKPPYVTVGSEVKEGDVLFIIESMKLMNEVTSEFSGKVEKILVENGQAVEYGQPIMVIG